MSTSNRYNGKPIPHHRRFPKPAIVERRPSTLVPSLMSDFKELVDVLKSIQSVIQCYSCHKPMDSVRTCLNGHGICHSCKTQCKKACPVCKAVVLDAKPAMLTEIIKLLPKPCSFADQGCERMILPNEMEHERFCRSRPSFCRFKSCDWKGMAKELLMHLEKFHGKEMVRVPTQTSILVSFNTQTAREGLGVIVAFNNIFWQHIRVKQGRLMHVYQYVPTEKPNKKFSVFLNFHTPEISYCGFTPVHLDSFDVEQLFKDRETFCLPKKTAVAFAELSGVKYTFEIKYTNL